MARSFRLLIRISRPSHCSESGPNNESWSTGKNSTLSSNETPPSTGEPAVLDPIGAALEGNLWSLSSDLSSYFRIYLLFLKVHCASSHLSSNDQGNVGPV